MQTQERLTAVDLRDLPEHEHAALRQEAIKRGISFQEFITELVKETSKKLVHRSTPAQTNGGAK